MTVVALISVAALVVAPAHAASGTQTLCIGSRPHRVVYNIDGDSLETIENADVSVQPSPELEEHCLDAEQPHGDKAFCIGANVDATCTKAEASISLPDSLECSDCFVGLTTDVFYSLNVSDSRLNSVEFGLKDSRLRAEAEVAFQEKESKAAHGNVTLISATRTAEISFMIAKIIPVHIVMAMPTVLDYSLTADGEVEATVGAELDSNLGNHFVKWTHGEGFSRINTAPKVTLKPVLEVEVPASAKLGLELKTGIRVHIDKVLSYRIDMNSSLPVQVDLKDSDSEVCAHGDVDLPMDHEADLHFTLFGKKDEIAHYGPKELFRFQRRFTKCLPIAATSGVVVI